MKDTKTIKRKLVKKDIRDVLEKKKKKNISWVFSLGDFWHEANLVKNSYIHDAIIDLKKEGVIENVPLLVHKLHNEDHSPYHDKSFYMFTRPGFVSKDGHSFPAPPNSDEVAHAIARRYRFKICYTPLQYASMCGLDWAMPLRLVFCSSGPDMKYHYDLPKFNNPFCVKFIHRDESFMGWAGLAARILVFGILKHDNEDNIRSARFLRSDKVKKLMQSIPEDHKNIMIKEINEYGTSLGLKVWEKNILYHILGHKTLKRGIGPAMHENYVNYN